MAITTVVPSTAYFNVGTRKLVLMTISTCSVYSLYWLYKNWIAEREYSREPLVPAARAFFGVFFIYSLAFRVKERTLALDLTPQMKPALVAIAFIVLSFCGNLRDPLWLLANLAGLALVPLQSEMARANTAGGVGIGPEARFSVLNIVWLTIAALLWFLIIVGLFLPEVE